MDELPCFGCLVPTDLGVTIAGQPSWIQYILVMLDVRVELQAKVRTAIESVPDSPDRGTFDMPFCTACAIEAEFDEPIMPSYMLQGLTLPVISQFDV